MPAHLTAEAVGASHCAVHISERPGEGPTMVLLHGIPGSSASWDPLVQAFGAGPRLLIPDLVGFGGSDRTDDIRSLHAAGQAEALAPALAPLLGERPVLVGHDFGGPVAIELIARLPGRFSALVLVSTNVLADTPIPFPLSLVNAPLMGNLAARLLFSRLSLRMMYRQGSKRRKLDSRNGVGDSAQARAIATIFCESLRHLPEIYGPLERALANIDLPALVVWGDSDPFFGVDRAERTVAALRNATMRVVDYCGHFLPEEAPEELAAAILSFVGTPRIQ